jgi:uncharacterized lipoprotein NlpE involved in copper resistance
MKMKKNIIFIFLVCLILVGCNDQTKLNKEKNEYVTINISTPSGWSLTIKQDGSGQVGFGSHAGDFAGFEKNTFDFSDVTQKLEPKLEPKGSISTQIAVSLWKKGETSINAKYISNKTLVSKLFEKALSAITYNKERIEKIYKEKKPVSF